MLPTKTSKPPRRRRRKSRYKTGIHISPKCPTPVKYRSGWEFVICLQLDSDPRVVGYTYEPFSIPYMSNVKSGKVRNYFPDFLVSYADGQRRLVEVKRENQMNNLIVKKKAEAAKLWCVNQQQKISYEFWTEKMILPLMKVHGILPAKRKPAKKKRTRKVSPPKTPR